jgi:hypothetical protein
MTARDDLPPGRSEMAEVVRGWDETKPDRHSGRRKRDGTAEARLASAFEGGIDPKLRAGDYGAAAVDRDPSMLSPFGRVEVSVGRSRERGRGRLARQTGSWAIEGYRQQTPRPRRKEVLSTTGQDGKLRSVNLPGVFVTGLALRGGPKGFDQEKRAGSVWERRQDGVGL